MTQISLPIGSTHTGSNLWADVYNNDAAITTVVNGDIRNDNISASAAIATSKLATGASGTAAGAFSAYRNAALSLATAGIVTFDTEEFDVSSWLDTTSNKGRYTPLVAGYYRLSAGIIKSTVLSADTKYWAIGLYKNGSLLKSGSVVMGTAGNPLSVGSWLVQANGSTDYYEIAVGHNETGSVALGVAADNCYFQGELIGRS